MNGFAIGFGVIVAAVCGGVDYISQAESAGKGPGEFSVAAYAATVGDRVGTLLSPPPEVPALPARAFLPEAPEGWERRAWTSARDGTFGDPDEAGADPVKSTFIKDMNDSTSMRAAAAWQDGKVNKRAESEVWEYAGPTGTIRLSARLNRTTGKVFRSKLKDDPRSVNVMLQNLRPVKLGKPGGLTWYVSRRDEFDSEPVTPGARPVFLRAYMGDDILLTAFAEGNHAALLALLEAIDYDGLNSLQDRPARKVGSDGPALNDAQRKVFLRRLAKIETDDQIAGRSYPSPDKPQAAAPDTAKSDSGGFFSRLGLGGGLKTAKSPDESAPKRLQLNSDNCSSGRVGKFCGVN